MLISGKMAEDTFKRVTGANPLFPTLHGILPITMPVTGSPIELTDALVPSVQEDPEHFSQSTSDLILNMPDIAPSHVVDDIQNLGDKIG